MASSMKWYIYSTGKVWSKYGQNQQYMPIRLKYGALWYIMETLVFYTSTEAVFDGTYFTFHEKTDQQSN